jgi:hypothetical protein
MDNTHNSWALIAAGAVFLTSGCIEPVSQGAATNEQRTQGRPSPSAVSETVDDYSTDVELPYGEPAAELAPPPPPVLDPCDEPSFADVDWSTEVIGSFRFHYFEGTAAERDLELIAEQRQEAYERIRGSLDIEAAPSIDAFLSPNRVAAVEHGVGRGNAYPGRDRYEVIYNGEEGSYETVRYGHEVTHLLAHYLVPAGYWQLTFLSEGIAEYFDQSERDLHESYAEQLNAGVENPAYVASFDDADVYGDNYGRAGSFVQAFVDVNGVEALPELLRRTAVTWDRGCYRHDDLGCIDSPASLSALLEHAIDGMDGASWEATQTYWQSTMEDVLAYHTVQLSGRDRAEVEWILGYMDYAVDREDGTAYRTAMDGFYCDWLDEESRERLARRMANPHRAMESTVLAVYPTAHKNYPTARALVSRVDRRGVIDIATISLERFPAGWRVTWMPDWR